MVLANRRIDFFFSYWIDIWCLIYIIYHHNDIIKNKGCNTIIYNPKFALLVAIFINIVEFTSMIYFMNSRNHIIIYFIIVSIGKGIPLAYLRNTKICQRDIYASLFLFSIYLLWMYWNGVTIFDYILQAYENVKNNNPVGPVTKYFMYENEKLV